MTFVKNLLLALFVAGSIIGCSEKSPNNFLIGSCFANLEQPPEWRCNVEKFLEIRNAKKNPYMAGGFFYFGQNTSTGIFYGINRLNPAEPLRSVHPVTYEVIENAKKVKVIENIDGCMTETSWEKDGKRFFSTMLKQYGDCNLREVEINNRIIKKGREERLIFPGRLPPPN